MKLNLGIGLKASGNPGSRNDRGGKKEKSPSTAGISANIGKSQAKGKPGNRNPRKGDVELPNSLSGNSYGGSANRGDKAVSTKVEMGNPGNRNPRGGRVQKHEMFMG